MKHFVMAITAMLFAAQASAVCNSDFCHQNYIERITVTSNGTIYISTDGDESVLSCNTTTYLTIPADTVGKEMMYSALLAAQLAGKKVETIQVTDAPTEPCYVQYINIDRQ